MSSPPESIMDIRDNDVNSHNLLLHLNSRLETFPLLNWWLLENGEIRGVEGVEEVLLKRWYNLTVAFRKLKRNLISIFVHDDHDLD